MDPSKVALFSEATADPRDANDSKLEVTFRFETTLAPFESFVF